MFRVVELIVADWRRYLSLHKKMNPLLFLIVLFRNPGMHFSVVYRIERYLLNSDSLILKILGAGIYPFYFIYTYYFLDIDISPRVNIDGGLYIHNKGVIFTDKVQVGKNLTIIAPITLGTKSFYRITKRGLVLGDDVTIYTGARVIGEFTIGNNVVIGANAVVLKDVSSNCVVGGVPAKILKRLSSRPNTQ